MVQTPTRNKQQQQCQQHWQVPCADVLTNMAQDDSRMMSHPHPLPQIDLTGVSESLCQACPCPITHRTHHHLLSILKLLRFGVILLFPANTLMWARPGPPEGPIPMVLVGRKLELVYT